MIGLKSLELPRVDRVSDGVDVVMKKTGDVYSVHSVQLDMARRM